MRQRCFQIKFQSKSASEETNKMKFALVLLVCFVCAIDYSFGAVAIEPAQKDKGR